MSLKISVKNGVYICLLIDNDALVGVIGVGEMLSNSKHDKKLPPTSFGAK